MRQAVYQLSLLELNTTARVWRCPIDLTCEFNYRFQVFDKYAAV